MPPESPRLQECVPTIISVEPRPNGAEARIRNQCDDLQRIWLSAVLYDAPGGQPLATTHTRTAFLEPDQTRTVTVTTSVRSRFSFFDEDEDEGMDPGGDGTPPAPQAPPRRSGQPPADEKPPLIAGAVVPYMNSAWVYGEEDDADAAVDELCIEVASIGGTGCLRTAPQLQGALEVLRRLEVGPQVMAAASDYGVTIKRELLFGSLAEYQPRTRTVTVSYGLDNYSDWERAVVLAHELQHVLDHTRGLLPTASAVECLARERAAFAREAQGWRELWRGQLPEPRDEIQESLNQSVTQPQDDPAAYTRSLTRRYRHQCDR